MQTDRSITVLDYSNIFNVSVGIVVKKDDKYLLIEEEEDNRGFLWNFPSGKANFREKLTSAAKRECLEETGYSVNVTGIVSFYYYTTPKNSQDKRKDRITLRINFACEIDESIPQTEPEEKGIKVSWVPENDLKQIDQDRKFRNWIASKTAIDALSNKTYPLSIFTEK